MAHILIEAPNTPGESIVDGFEDQMEAVAIRQIIEIPLSRHSGGGASGTPAATKGRHGDIVLTRVRDRGSPKLASACSAGTNLGLVKVRIFRQEGDALKDYMTYELTDTYVSRYEPETVDESGAAYLPHFGRPGHPLASSTHGASSLHDSPSPEQRRLSPRPAVSVVRGVPTALDIERVWLSPKAVKWTYVDSDGGKVEKGYNIQTGKAL